MDHSLSQNTPLHWGYSGSSSSTATNQHSNTWAPVSRGVKRTMSESDDCDDVFSEESSKEQCTSPGDADSCQMLSRKKRRGVIEKKRRDRINTSLTELKRLVPSAYEKQGSAKLEKAEILQMTVDHLKMLHAKGLDSLAYDPHKFAMDYHNIGFRECATEVARYLVTIEGMDIQDPLRLRLMSHLQCFVAQRELATKQATATPWTSYGAPGQPYGVPGTPTTPVTNPVTPLLHHQPPPPPPPAAPLPHHQANLHDASLGHYDTVNTSTCPSQSRHHSLQSTSTLTPLTTTTTSALGYSPHQYHMNLNSYPTPTSTNNNQNYNPSNSSSQMKPYRPWGAEVAY